MYKYKNIGTYNSCSSKILHLSNAGVKINKGYSVCLKHPSTNYNIFYWPPYGTKQGSLLAVLSTLHKEKINLDIKRNALPFYILNAFSFSWILTSLQCPPGHGRFGTTSLM